MAGSARFGSVGRGARDSSFYYSASTAGLIRLTDRVTNQFIGGAFQQATKEVHARAALAVQRGMVEHLQKQMDRNEYQRPNSGHLARAIMDERNVDITASAFVVGRPSWLDKSYVSDYWRRIEQGGPGFSTRALFTGGFPRRSNQKMYGPWSPGGGDRRQPPGYPHARMPQFAAGVAIQVSAQRPYRYMTDGGTRGYESFGMYTQYERTLASIGIPISRVSRLGKK